MACDKPDDIKVRIKETKITVTKEGGPEKYQSFDKYSGFTCLNKDQDDGQCMDYEVSLCCLPGPENGTVLTFACSQPDWYLNYVDKPFMSSIQVIISEYGLISSLIMISHLFDRSFVQTIALGSPKQKLKTSVKTSHSNVPIRNIQIAMTEQSCVWLHCLCQKTWCKPT